MFLLNLDFIWRHWLSQQQLRDKKTHINLLCKTSAGWWKALLRGSTCSLILIYILIPLVFCGLWPANNILVYLPSSPPIHICGPITAHTSSEVISVLSVQASFVDCDQTGRLSGTTQKIHWGMEQWGGEESSSVCLLCGGGEKCQEAEVTRRYLDPKQTESNVRGWRQSTSGCWSYCGGKTGWTGTDQLKPFNPHLQPRKDQTEFPGDFQFYSADGFFPQRVLSAMMPKKKLSTRLQT